MKTLSLRAVLCTLAFVGLGIAGCLDTPDPTKLQCKTQAGCPADYFCSNGKCLPKGSGVGGANDASIGGNGGAAGGAGQIGVPDARDSRAGETGNLDSSGGGRGGSVIDGPVDAPSDTPGLPVGSVCQGNGDCAEGHCIDGVCCESLCDGCKACSNAYTGKDDGKCAPVSIGQDPHTACADDTATNACGNDGTCDGQGSCRKVGAGHLCGKASCGDGKTFTPAPTCDGLGACVDGKSKACDPYPCADTGCLVTCDPAATTSPCDKGSYCEASTKVCVTQKPDGQSAKSPLECVSGVIADGVCCHEACAGCKACTAALNGQAENTTGQCLPVKAGLADPHGTCTAGPVCGLDGKCDGAGACRYTASGTRCADDSCSGSTLTKSSCDGPTHTCAAATSACPNGLVCGSTSACKTSCTVSSDCVSGFCSSGACKSKVADGGVCGGDGECQNGHCIAGICCATVCGVCNSCSTGTCKPADNGKACGTSQFCNNGVCGSCPDGSSCNPNGNLCQTGKVSCSTGTSVCTSTGNEAAGTSCGTNTVCNGAGTCVSCTAGVSCQPSNACQTGKTSCATGSSQCVTDGNQAAGTSCGTNMVCDGAGTCVSCTAGTSCQPSNACQTGRTSCSSGSSQCVANGSQAAGTSCGTNMVCDGAGTCVSCTAGTSCQPSNACQTGRTSCSNGSQQCVANGNQAAGTSCGNNMVCDGAGTCGSCTAGVSCQPSNACQTGRTSCSTGSQQCVANGNQPAGTSCGSNLYCNPNGVCNCTGGGSCTPSNPCQTGSYSCSTGYQSCVATGNQPVGTSCATGKTCNSSQQCVCANTNNSCGAGTSCVACGPDTHCSNGDCVCDGTLLTCGGCAVWTFETTGQLQGWTSSGVTLRQETRNGKGVLAFDLTQDGAGHQPTISVNLCPGGVTTNVAQLYMRGMAYFVDGAGTPALTGNEWIAIVTSLNGMGTGSFKPVTGGVAVPFGPISLLDTMNGSDVTSVGLSFVITSQWFGKVYIDEVKLTSN